MQSIKAEFTYLQINLKNQLFTNSMKHKITIGEPYKYISSYAIDGIEDLESLLLSTQYFQNLTFEQEMGGEVMSWIMWTGHIEGILEEIEEKEEKTQDESEGSRAKQENKKTASETHLASLLEALLNAMQEAEIEFILIDRS
jgi:hypothetical protein